jgi:hypothetical protein
MGEVSGSGGSRLGKIFRYAIRDPSSWSLLISNILVLIIAIIEGWTLYSILWTYWYQSMIIGVFYAIKLSRIRTFPSEWIKDMKEKGTKNKDGSPITDAKLRKYSLIFPIFFIIHYGFFHLVYAIFLGFSFGLGEKGILPSIGIFILNHAFSFFYNFRQDIAQEKDAARAFLKAPYERVLPLHIFIIFGTIISIPFFIFGKDYMVLLNIVLVTFFGLLKAFVDLILHAREHDNNSSLILPNEDKILSAVKKDKKSIR